MGEVLSHVQVERRHMCVWGLDWGGGVQITKDIRRRDTFQKRLRKFRGK